jgi:acyl-CoA thioester hydrolase
MNAETNRFLAVTLDVRVSTYDIDYAGHVSNISYFRWLEDMRLKILEAYFPLDELMKEGYMPILAGSQIKYKRAIRLFDKPKGEMWISDITAATMTFTGRFLVNGEVCTEASHQGLFISSTTAKPCRLPPRIVEAYKAWQEIR